MRTILFALLLLPLVCGAQTGKRILFAAGRKVDTAYDKGSLIVDSAVVVNSLLNNDTNQVLTTGTDGRFKFKSVGTVLGLDNVLINNALAHRSLSIGKIKTASANRSVTLLINPGDSTGLILLFDSSGVYPTSLQAYSPGGYAAINISDPTGSIVGNAGGPDIGLATPHIIGNGGTPSIAAHQGAGTAPTISVSGTDAAFTIILTAGVSPTLGDTIVTITYALPYLTGSTVRGYTLSPVNANAANLAKQPYFIRTGSTRTKTELMGGGAVLIAGQTYEWSATIMR